MEKNSIISRSDVMIVITALLNNWYLLIVFPLVFFVASYLYAHRLQEVYAARCQIMLKDESSVDNVLNGAYSGSNAINDYAYTAGQMRFIKSSVMLQSVFDEVDFGVSYFIVGRLKTTELYDHIPFKVTYDERAQACFGIKFKFTFIDANHFQLDYEKEGVSKVKTFQFNELILDDGLYLKVESGISGKDVETSGLKDLKYIFELHPTSFLLNKYKNSISISSIEYTSIIELVLNDEVPQRAVEFLELLSDNYLETTIQNQNDVIEKTIDYIDNLLVEISEEINGVQSELDGYKESNDIINIAREEEAFFTRLSDLELRKQELNLQLNAMDDLTGFLLESDPEHMIMPPSVYLIDSDNEIHKKIELILENQSAYRAGLESSTESNPKNKSFLEKIEAIKKDLLRYKANQEQAIEEKIKLLDAQIRSLESKVKVFPKNQREILSIQKKITINEGLYDYLLSKRAENLIAKAGLIPKSKIIEKPVSIGIVYPNRTQIKTKATAAGFALALVIILIQELFFRKVKTVNELQSRSSRSVLGSIPFQKSMPLNYTVGSTKDRGAVIQSLRAIRTNLQFYSKGAACHKIMVTSLLPGEGKTFVSTNIACILALAEKKVLIIDFDLHKPRLHKALNLEMNKGLSSYLSKGEDIESIIQNTHIDSLKAISSGPVPPNASELVLKKEVSELIDYASAHFDYLIIDTPPVSLISDSLSLVEKVDTKLFVLSSMVTTKSSLDYIEKIITELNMTGEAFILNKERRTRLDYYYARYGYGYGGYGYGGYGYGGYGYGGYGEDKSESS